MRLNVTSTASKRKNKFFIRQKLSDLEKSRTGLCAWQQFALRYAYEKLSASRNRVGGGNMSKETQSEEARNV